MKKILQSLYMGVMLCMPMLTLAQSTWVGGVSTDWYNANNWSPTVIPTAVTSVTINSGATNYPVLTANVTVGGLNMTANSALHLATNNIVVTGNTNMVNATVDGAGDIISLASGAFTISNNILVADLNISGYTSNFNMNNNKITGDVVLADAITNNSGSRYLGGNHITGNLNMQYSGGGIVYEGFSSGDTITGNFTVAISGMGTFHSSYSRSSQIGGNMTVTRTSSGNTQLFSNTDVPAFVGGNLDVDVLGTLGINQYGSFKLDVAGTMDIYNDTKNGGFILRNTNNHTSGGTIQVDSAVAVSCFGNVIQSSVIFQGMKSGFDLFNNRFTGDFFLSDASFNSSGSKYLGGHTILGNLTINYNGTGIFYESYSGAAGDSISGNVNINIAGTGNFQSSYSHPIQAGGNFTVNRTAVGPTVLFYSTSSPTYIGGNLSVTTAGGLLLFNSTQIDTVFVAGMIDITASNLNNNFFMRKMKNETPGGTIAVDSSSSIQMFNNKIVGSTSFGGAKGSLNISNNFFQGNLQIGDATSNASASKYVGGNTVVGNFTIDYAGTGIFYESYSAGTGDSITGNVNFNIANTGTFYSSYSYPMQVGGNLNVTRTTPGQTSLYSSLNRDANIGGNVDVDIIGLFYFNQSGTNKVNIAGTLNLVDSNKNAGFIMRNVNNSTAGGNVFIDSAGGYNFDNNNIKAGVSLPGNRASFTFNSNKIVGNVFLSDVASNNSSSRYLSGNYITGNFGIEYNGAGYIYESYSGAAPDSITGNVSFNINGTGFFQSSYNSTTYIGGNLDVNRTAPGTTVLYLTVNGPVGYLGGNFTLNSVAGSNTDIGSAAGFVKIGGTIDINIPSSQALFSLDGIINETSGGTILVNGATSLVLRKDSLLAKVFLTDYTSNLFFYDNLIKGSTKIENATTNGSGQQYIGGNLFEGNFSLGQRGTGIMYESISGISGTGNIVKGIDSIYAGNTGTLNMSYSYPHRADSSVVRNTGTSGINFTSIIFGGTSGGTYTNIGAIPSVFSQVTMRKAAGKTLTLLDSLGISSNLTFDGGHIQSSTSSPLYFLDNSGSVGFSDTSHVKGTVVKIGNDAFTFPLGDEDALSTIAISAPAANEIYVGSYYNNPPQSAGYDTTMLSAGLDHVSRNEYWILDAPLGSGGVLVTLGYNQPNSGVITNMADLRVARWDGTQWVNHGNGGTTGTLFQGTVQSSNTISTFSPFTLGASTSGNPLPVEIVSFIAKKDGQHALLNWTSAQERNILNYEVQHSTEGVKFETVAQQAAKGGIDEQDYHFVHQAPALGNNFYRLKINEQDGSHYFSETRLLNFSGKSLIAVNAYPNPVKDALYISGIPTTTAMQLQVYNATGQLVLSANTTKETESIQLGTLSAGVYLLRIVDANGKDSTTPLRFVKE